ncbi:hypothetical protein BS50DRAFT_567811 [Corynespora cassiicola Philippines]|uniref:Uncharacterized protein n=1 Tax=Corynespora cassiicola Philippines TaxID=1448308 RepID=A0A2T2PBM8_CORCC|nr:hypothetical protein BS50DRAFT_567811 [Corynespora cassiicola Philippines]
MSRALTKKEAQQQALAQQQEQQQYVRDVETQEHHANAGASAGLNLNIFGALSGAFSSKSKKTTHRNKDGSSHEVEDRYEQGVANAAAHGNGTAYAQGEANEMARKTKGREIGQAQGQSVKKLEEKRVDHLGIEG